MMITLPPFRPILIVFLTVSLSGFFDSASWAQAVITDSASPILRHAPPVPMSRGDMLRIRAVVEDESEITEVDFWYRASGEQDYRKVPMTKVSENIYEFRISITQEFKRGMEYYLAASDRLGNKGTDGTRGIPYFAEVREIPGPPKAKRPWWKNPWFWASVVLAIGGGAAAVRSTGNSEASGTIIVQ